MRAGIPIIGSLLWDQKSPRPTWRSRLAVDRKILVSVPFRYGRRSSTRGHTFTMVFDTHADHGEALVVPFKEALPDPKALVAEAEALWQAERASAELGSIAADWGCVGVRFQDEAPAATWLQAWSDRFGETTPIPPVTTTGKLDMHWPTPISRVPVDLDVLLAAATLPDEPRPTPAAIADAWVDQNQGYEEYFFENVRHGIRASEDLRIWRRIKERAPVWLSNSRWSEAIKILEAEDAQASHGSS
jgi:hypothetical protein